MIILKTRCVEGPRSDLPKAEERKNGSAVDPGAVSDTLN